MYQQQQQLEFSEARSPYKDIALSQEAVLGQLSTAYGLCGRDADCRFKDYLLHPSPSPPSTVIHAIPVQKFNDDLTTSYPFLVLSREILSIYGSDGESLWVTALGGGGGGGEKGRM